MRTCHLLTKCLDNASLANTLQITRTKLNKMCSYSMIFDSFLNNFFDESENWFPMRSALIVKLLLIQYIYIYTCTCSGRNRVKLLGVSLSKRGYRISWRGGGVKAFTSTPPLGHCPRRHPPSKKLKNTPTLGHSQAHPPLDIARVTSSTFQGGGGGVIGPGHAHFAYR